MLMRLPGTHLQRFQRPQLTLWSASSACASCVGCVQAIADDGRAFDTLFLQNFSDTVYKLRTQSFDGQDGMELEELHMLMIPSLGCAEH